MLVFVCLIWTIILVVVAGVDRFDRLDWVDPFIGTGGHGFGIGAQYPGACVPFGLARVSPDTSLYGDVTLPWQNFGGYYYHDKEIRMISHTQSVGSGAFFMGFVGVMPAWRPPKSTEDVARHETVRSPFLHSSESASPGYYAVSLATTRDLLVELTATSFVGVHRYSGPTVHAGGSPLVIQVDATYASEWDLIKPSVHVKDANVTVDPTQQRVTGTVAAARCDQLHIYFVVQVVSGGQEALHGYGVWGNGTVTAGGTHARGSGGSRPATVAGAYIEVVPSADAVELAVALSTVSLDQAQQNLQAVLKEHGQGSRSSSSSSNSLFDGVHQAARSLWADTLAVVDLDPVVDVAEQRSHLRSTPWSHDNQTRVTLYTALYNAHKAPTMYSEITSSGQSIYRGFDGAVHSAVDTGLPNGGFYSDMSLWDTHRSQFPLLALLAPDRYADVLQSLVNDFLQGGAVPRWPLGQCYTGSMIGQHATVCFADGAAKGLAAGPGQRGFNLTAAYQGAFQGATQQQRDAGRASLPFYEKHGWVPFDQSTDAAARTLAYAYDDWAVGQMAARLGRTADAKRFALRALNYRNVWTNQTAASDQQHFGFFCPRLSSGQFQCPKSWTDVFADIVFGNRDGYVEGDAWQYRWFVPHDVPGLIDLFGSRARFVEQLEFFMSKSLDYGFNVLPNPYYWAGNEPDLLAPWLFSLAGRLDRTQFWTRQLAMSKYIVDPSGLPGNDDYGTMSAWLIFAQLGFYPLSGSDRYALGAPSVPAADVRVGPPANGWRLRIRTVNFSAQHWRADRIELDGKLLPITPEAVITHEQLLPAKGNNHRNLTFFFTAVA